MVPAMLSGRLGLVEGAAAGDGDCGHPGGLRWRHGRRPGLLRLITVATVTAIMINADITITVCNAIPRSPPRPQALPDDRAPDPG